MCLLPKVIVNPAFYNRRHLFEYVCSDGVMNRQSKVVTDSFGYPCAPHYYPIPYVSCEKINPDLVDSYFGVDTSTGECVPTYLVVPCGKCLECAVSRQTEWKNRMILEQSCHKNKPCFFLTLTYDDEHLPKDGVSKSDARDFIKSLHDFFRHHGLPSFRSALFSEYGSLRGRPHYHAVIFGFHTDEVLTVKKKHRFHKELNSWSYITRHYRGDYFIMRFAVNHCWKRGFTYTVNVRDFKAFGYISKYVAKNIVSPQKSGSNPNFVVASRCRGIGGLCLDDEDFLRSYQRDYPRITVNCMGETLEFTLPTYLRRIICPDRSHIIKAKYVRMYKDFVFNLVRLSRHMSSCPKSDEYVRIMSILFDGLSKYDVSCLSTLPNLFRDVCSKFPLGLHIFPIEYTDFNYALKHLLDYRKDSSVYTYLHSPVTIAWYVRELYECLMTYEFPLERYRNFLKRTSIYKHSMIRYMENFNENHPVLRSPLERASILSSHFKYQYRVKDEQ